jgi:hypothetical protein
MKSAFELALERTGGALNDLEEEKKHKITEIDKIAKAKLAELEISYDEKLKKATSLQDIEQIKDDMAVERASILSKSERDKEAVRNS